MPWEKVFQCQSSEELRKEKTLLSELLTINRIQIQKEAKDWKEAIELVAQPLINDESIKPSYVRSMIKAVEEHGPYIVLMKHMALAHARPEEGVNHIAISAITLKSPVNFGHKENDPVSIIFCLAAEGSDAHLELISELSNLLEEEKLSRLIKSTNSEEFREILISQI